MKPVDIHVFPLAPYVVLSAVHQFAVCVTPHTLEQLGCPEVSGTPNFCPKSYYEFYSKAEMTLVNMKANPGKLKSIRAADIFRLAQR